MTIQLNHTIVRVRDKQESTAFLTEILGLSEPTAYYAFLVDESDFDDIFERIKQRDLPYWADPFKRRPSEFNTNDGGRGVYWEDPNGHLLEIITRPYGSG